MPIYFVILCICSIRVSSISLFPLGALSELGLLVVVMASESLLFLKIRRMMLFIVLMALLILWVLRTLSSFSPHSWKI